MKNVAQNSFSKYLEGNKMHVYILHTVSKKEFEGLHISGLNWSLLLVRLACKDVVSDEQIRL